MEKLKIAIQKSGRLSEKSLEIISEAGINLGNGSRKLISPSSNFPVEILFLRDDDIPKYIADGVADAGIVGENVFAESDVALEIHERLGFARCRLSLAVQKSVDYKGTSFFAGKRIATSYPNILRCWLDKKGIKADIHVIAGSVEIATGIGLADGIFDIVSSGSTLLSNGLKEVERIMDSEAVLLGSPALAGRKAGIMEEFLFRLRTVLASRNNKYILLNAPDDKLDKIIEAIPGMKSPTVLPLALKGWSSVHSVVNENDFWQVIGKLREYGAQGILVIPIEKMIV
ncbi:MAG: ATP phosphoribosyltransferase [Marinilabiliales bacterium]|nr:MAG: ATP phosphoribosyltransferase [Marinilabiliales bacterium]